jgi:hypothetical protein
VPQSVGRLMPTGHHVITSGAHCRRHCAVFPRNVVIATRKEGATPVPDMKPHPPLDPDVVDAAPAADALTAYDYEHLITYLGLLDAEADGAEWTEVARIVLHIDSTNEPARAQHAWETHLLRTADTH